MARKCILIMSLPAAMILLEIGVLLKFSELSNEG